MIEIGLWFLKKFGAYIAIALMIGGVWLHGFQTSEKNWIQRESDAKAQSDAIQKAATDHVNHVQQTLAESARIINENSQQNQQHIAALSTDNQRLLTDRMQRDRAARRCRTVAKTATEDSSGNEELTDAWVVQPGDAQSIVERFAYADEIVETARALQLEIQSYREAINGSTNQPVQSSR